MTFWETQNYGKDIVRKEGKAVLGRDRDGG